MFVHKARKSNRLRKCNRCGKRIQEGESYWWLSIKRGNENEIKYFCHQHEPRRSDQTGSPKLSWIYRCQETLEDSVVYASTLSDLGEMRAHLLDSLRRAIDGAIDVREGYSISMDNLREHFPQGSAIITDMKRKIEAINLWAASLDAASRDIEHVERATLMLERVTQSKEDLSL